MEIIVCGAGHVGTGIARQLTSEDNHVTIIDTSEEAIRNISDTLDAYTIAGFPSHPTVLEEAGAQNAEMIIAVTTSDEVNMTICQVAHSLFDIPKKIARIRHQNYLQPMWKNLYRHDHIPIDYIISPEMEVAEGIINRLHLPGAMDSIPFADGRMKVIEVRCEKNCPILGQTMGKIREHAVGLKMSILCILRNGNLMPPYPAEKLCEGDEVFFVADSNDVKQVMVLFGHEEKEARRILIIGGGNIGLAIAEELEREDLGVNAKIVEFNKKRAEYIAGKLVDTIVLNGNALDQDIMLEANISSTETIVSVTNDDEVNILSSLLAKRYGCQRSVALVNKGGAYSPLISSLGIDVTVNPREITVSSILRHIRIGRVRAAHSICSGEAEIIETEAVNNSIVIGKKIKDLELPLGVQVGALLRKGETIILDDNTVIAENDRIIILSPTNQVNRVDKIFSARLDYF